MRKGFPSNTATDRLTIYLPKMLAKDMIKRAVDLDMTNSYYVAELVKKDLTKRLDKKRR